MPDSKQHDAHYRGNPAVERRRKVLPAAGDQADAAHGSIELERLEHALEESEQRYRGLVALSREAVLIQSEGAFVFASKEAVALLGAGSPEQLLGKRFLDFVHPDDRDAVARRIGTLAAPGRSMPFFRHRLFRIDGAALDVDVAANACGYRDKPAVQLLVRDVAERSRLESRLRYLAQYDALTKLPNRSQLRERLEGAMARAVRNKQLVGIMFLDLDHFRALNATQGQASGDLVLEQTAERLRHGMRKSDTVVRLDGDAFAVILEGLAEKEDALVAARRELESLSRPLLLDSQEVRLTASIGLTVFPLDSVDLDTLLRNADAAMHYAKAHGRNTCQPYFPELDVHREQDAQRRAGIERNLASLTPREREVLDMLVSGKANKTIAHLLGTSPRTIEQHRARIMNKMQADSLPVLVRMVLDLRG